MLDPGTGELEPLDLPFTASMPYVRAHGNRFATLAGSPTEPTAIVVVDVADGSYEKVVRTSDFELAPESISVGRPIEFAAPGGRTAHAFYYPPTNADFEGPADELPPLWTLIHGGPTSQAKLAFSLSIQFLTSRGWGVVDVNYGGSTGFGRPYRELLDGEWGVVDLEDCIAAARHLADAGEVDPKRLSIAGGSAGGYTTLLALAQSDVFAAGTSSYGVAELVTFAETTHKFESRYLDWLLGTLPEAIEVYRERSPLTHADNIRAAALIAQGLDDKVVPPDAGGADRRCARAQRRPARLPAVRGRGPRLPPARVWHPLPLGGAVVLRAGLRLRAGRRRRARSRSSGSSAWRSPSSRATPSTCCRRARSRRS